MPTGARKNRKVDMGRLREAIRGPGADTRVWLATARVDREADAITWDAEIGWLVDVTFYGGPLDQEGPVPCRLGSAFAQAGAGKEEPPGLGCEVLVAITDGDGNANPVIVARMHNAGDCEAPLTAVGFPLTEATMAETHVTVTPHGELAEYGGSRLSTAPEQELRGGDAVALRAPVIDLGGTGATALTPAVPPTDVAVKGNALAAAQEVLTAALNAYAGALLAAPIAGAVNVASASGAATALTSALEEYTTAVTAALSAKVRLE